jgi:hypothetical protein
MGNERGPDELKLYSGLVRISSVGVDNLIATLGR